MEDINKNKYKPQERWQKKVGLISKSYKLNQEVVDAFASACNKKGTSQAKQLTLMMKEFIIETEKEAIKEDNKKLQKL